MKNSIILVFLLTITYISYSQDEKSMLASDVTTYYFIRHAEKYRSNSTERNPHLTTEGLKRADNWNTILGNVTFDAVYSTDYHRTIETAKPTADTNNLEITIYDPKTLNDVSGFLTDTKDQTVLVVGHSDTTPAFVNAILKQKKHENIDDSNNGNLYIVTIIGGKVVDQVLTIN